MGRNREKREIMVQEGKYKRERKGHNRKEWKGKEGKGRNMKWKKGKKEKRRE